MAAVPSSCSLMATHLGSTCSNSSYRSAKYPGEAIAHHPAAISESPLSHSWPQCWSPPGTRNLPRPPEA
ncbi:pancreatic progenitor cell differentiation and proliferation factor-like [Pteropus alecto]|uniref:pancreatic progenitor cell differentiation and proliferation factor-like n=1 Tax=Pteropus alecto TaxID=9402 RepID=UPI000D538E7F|nr:pancreatic progenitor cell differentiation and proliferation factor-like [Pteropus alecto]